MNIDFNYKVMVDIWSDYTTEKLELVQGNFSEELKKQIRKEIIENINKSNLIHTNLKLEEMK
tara:strand:- start:269 stop:454 length:186 start_codon:yes stop_codon:yes gene_type:complete